jgi:hypothetical protein
MLLGGSTPPPLFTVLLWLLPPLLSYRCLVKWLPTPVSQCWLWSDLPPPCSLVKSYCGLFLTLCYHSVLAAVAPPAPHSVGHFGWPSVLVADPPQCWLVAPSQCWLRLLPIPALTVLAAVLLTVLGCGSSHPCSSSQCWPRLLLTVLAVLLTAAEEEEALKAEAEGIPIVSQAVPCFA